MSERIVRFRRNPRVITSAAACRELGYKVDEASTTNKFVQVSGPGGSTLVAFYGSWGGFQLQVAEEALVASLIADLKAIGVHARTAPGDSTGLRVAIGGDKADLAKALSLVTGEKAEVKAVKAETKTEVAAPLEAVQEPVVEAPAIDIGAIVLAAITAGKSQKELLELIAALKA